MNLPDDLIAEVEARGLNVDELVAAAVREAVEDQVRAEERKAAFAAFIAEAETVALTEEEEARAQALVERVKAHLSKHKHAS